MKNFLISLTAIVAVMAYIGICNASPVSFGDSYYEFVQVSDPFTGTNNAWANVSADANASLFNGVNGHLATVTSQEENDFLVSLVSGSFNGYAGAWLGGKYSEGWLVGTETGQAFSYSNWGGNEPNNDGYIYMNIGTSFAGTTSGQWLDDSGVQGVPDALADPVIGYFIEYDVASPVPVPPSVLLLLTGIAGIMGFKIGKNK